MSRGQPGGEREAAPGAISTAFRPVSSRHSATGGVVALAGDEQLVLRDAFRVRLPGHLGGIEPGGVDDIRDELVGDPAAVLLALTGEEELDGVPELALTPGRDGHLRRLLRVGAEERPGPELEPDLAGADVVLDDDRQHGVGVLLAERALEVGELDEGDGRVGVTEEAALLWGAVEQLRGLRLAGHLALGPGGLSLLVAGGVRCRHGVSLQGPQAG